MLCIYSTPSELWLICNYYAVINTCILTTIDDLEQMHEHYDDVVEHAAGNAQFTDALHSLFRTLKSLRRPMGLAEQQRLIAQYVSDGESVLDAFTDVARIRVGEYVERGESYIYRESGDE